MSSLLQSTGSIPYVLVRIVGPLAATVIWTGVTNDNSYKVLVKCFIGYIYRNIV